MVDWLHRVQLKKGGADLSFASVLALEPLTWPAGPLTLRQVWQFYPYENSLVTVKATGKLVREALERAASCLADRRGARARLRLARGRRLRARPLEAGRQARRLAAPGGAGRSPTRTC